MSELKPGDISKTCDLDIQAEGARALHRVVRAMHDGHCPNCGYLAPSEEFYRPPVCTVSPALRRPGRHQCPRCGFAVTEQEARRALELFQPTFRRSVELFERWRKGELHLENIHRDSSETSGHQDGEITSLDRPCTGGPQGCVAGS